MDKYVSPHHKDNPIVKVAKRGKVLTPSSIGCLNVPTINLTANCLHGCVYW
jgi:hypothetical protein